MRQDIWFSSLLKYFTIIQLYGGWAAIWTLATFCLLFPHSLMFPFLVSLLWLYFTFFSSLSLLLWLQTINCLINGIFPYGFTPESLSTSPRQQENAILAITKENIRMEFSSFSFSGNIRQKSEEISLTLGCQTDHWNRVSQARGPTEGGGSLQSWDSSSHHCCWAHSYFLLGSCHPPWCWEAGCESPCLRGVPTWTPFQSGEIALLPLQPSHSPSLPSPGCFFQDPYLLEKQAQEANHLKAISAFMDHKLL